MHNLSESKPETLEISSRFWKVYFKKLENNNHGNEYSFMKQQQQFNRISSVIGNNSILIFFLKFILIRKNTFIILFLIF